MWLDLLSDCVSNIILGLMSLMSSSFCFRLASKDFMYARKQVQIKLHTLTYTTRFRSGIRMKLMVCRIGHTQIPILYVGQNLILTSSMHSETGFNSRKLMPKKKEHIAAGLYVTCSTKALVIADFKFAFGQR